MNYADVEAQGFLIYCISLNDYKKRKASFSTFLFRNLSGRLRDYCRQTKSKTEQDMYLGDAYFPEMGVHGTDSDCDLDFDRFKARETITTDEFLLYAECYLTPLAYNILKWLLADQLVEFRSKTNPSLVSISKKLQIELERLEIIWQELSDFWNFKGAAFYAGI